MSKKRNGRRVEVSAKALAEMGFCEKRVQLAHLYGDRVTPEQQLARTRGQAAHQRYLEEGMASARDRRCFVATCVFGPEAEETQALRAYRDAVLLHRWWGPWLVAVYYQVAPSVCRVLEWSPMATTGMRWLLRILAVACADTVKSRKLP